MPFGITMGDASGVGPEILLRAYHANQLANDVFAYGDAAILAAGAKLLELDISLNVIQQPSELIPGMLNVLDLDCLTSDDLTPGESQSKSGGCGEKLCAPGDGRCPRRKDQGHSHLAHE